MSKPSDRLERFGMGETMIKLKYYFIGLGIGIALGITIGMGI